MTTILPLALRNNFANEEVKSEFRYAYKPISLDEQVARLKEYFPSLGTADVNLPKRKTLPMYAEGWFAIPQWKCIGTTYTDALKSVLTKIRETRNGQFFNWQEGYLGPNRLRQEEHTLHALQHLELGQRQEDILVIPAQFGWRHRGRSVRRAREFMTWDEFGLCAFTVGIMLLTHPDRFQRYDDLYIDCAGSEVDDLDSDEEFDRAPYFRYTSDLLEFGADWIGTVDARGGSASGFILLG